MFGVVLEGSRSVFYDGVGMLAFGYFLVWWLLVIWFYRGDVVLMR